MQLETVEAERRTEAGKGVARKLRKDGFIPAVCYGQKKDPVSLTIRPRDVLRFLKGAKGRNSIFYLQVEGESDPRMVFLQDIQVHPVKRRLLHVDLLEVTRESRLILWVPVRVEGKSEGEKAGGQLHWVLKKIQVACRPDAVPVDIPIDVTAMDAGDVLYAEDLELPDGVEPMTKGRVPVVTVKLGRDEDEFEEGEEGEEGEGGDEAPAEGDEKPAEG